MPQRTETIESLPMAFEVVKQMQADGLEWGEGYRPLGRRALAEIIEGRMAEAPASSRRRPDSRRRETGTPCPRRRSDRRPARRPPGSGGGRR